MSLPWRGLKPVGLALMLLFHSLQALAEPQDVRVGAYHFPPYVEHPERAGAAGLLPELLVLLNRQQADFRFHLVPTSATRRYQDMARGRVDLMFFESLRWGWQTQPVQTVDLLIEDTEVYVAKAMAGRDQRYFDDFTGKRMALYSGYHYGFAGFNADQEQLRQTFQAVLTYSHDSNLLMVQRGRVDLTVVARSYLALYLTRHPQLRQALLVSERADQYYQHQALLRAQAPISSTQLGQLLEQLRGTAEYAALLARYDLQAR